MIEEQVSLAPFTTFKVGGPAQYYCAPNSVADLQTALEWLQKNPMEHFVLGKGSNLVVSDHGFQGLVIHLGKHFAGIETQGTTLVCQAGCLLHTAVKKSVDAGLAGIQNLGGIPGTLGGGAYINAGAYDQELCQVITQVTSIDLHGNVRIRDNAACGFSYRHSALMERSEIILEVRLELHKDDPKILREQMNAILFKRREKQPLELPNAGSMFKRPPGQYAGSLIEASGLKGLRVGDAAVSEKHANFVVNLGKAHAADIWELTEQIIAKVKADHGITLEREVIFLGRF